MITKSNNWKVHSHYDLVVVGAGPAGIGASIAAARRGVKVALIEKAAFPGGIGTQCNVPLYFGFDADVRQSTAGLSDEFVRRMDKAGCARFLIRSFLSGKYVDALEHQPIGDRELTKKVRFEPEMMKVIYNKMLLEAGVDCIFYSHMADVLVEEKTVKGILLAGLEGTYIVEGDYFADCTGNAMLCHLANPDSVENVSIDNGMHQSLFFDVGGVSPFDIKYVQDQYAQLYDDGLLPDNVWRSFNISINLAPGIVQIPVCYSIGNANDSKDMTRMDQELREQSYKVMEIIQNSLPGFEHCWMDKAGASIGVRISRRIYGIETITEDILFSDQLVHPVALHWKHIGGHSNQKEFNASWYRHAEGLAGVPMGALIPVAFDNVVVAGRCISGKLELVDSYRMMNTCMTTGEAAGLMTYLAINKQNRYSDLSYEELLPLMKENGFVLK